MKIALRVMGECGGRWQGDVDNIYPCGNVIDWFGLSLLEPDRLIVSVRSGVHGYVDEDGDLWFKETTSG